MKKTHLVYLFLLASYSCSSFANDVNCLKESAQINSFNNFILFEDTGPLDQVKEMRTQVRGSDDYLNADTKVTFDNCGSLLTMEGTQTKSFKNNGHELIGISHMNVNKAGKSWGYEFSFTMSIVDEKGINNQLVQQTTKGLYLTDDVGKINKTIGTSVFIAGDEKTNSKSVTTYEVNEDGKVTKSKQVGTADIENSTTNYFYNANGRLIKSKTDSTTEEFSYDEKGRDLSVKSIQELFTTETSVTTCKRWNESGRCTNAEMNTSTFFKGENGLKDETRTNRAEVTFDFIY